MYYRSIVPIMNNDLQDGFEVSATSTAGNPYRVFDGNKNGEANTYYRSSSSPSLPEYLIITFPKEYVLARYTIDLGYYHVNYSNMASWDLEGLVNGKWIVLHSGNNTTTANSLTFDITPTFVSGVRIKCKTRYGSNSWGLDELTLYELVYDEYVLVYHDEKYKKYDGSNWEIVTFSSPNESDFFNGNTKEEFQAIPQSAWNQLSGKVDFLFYTNNLNEIDAIAHLKTEPFEVYQHISETPEAIVYTELSDNIEITTTTEPYELYDEFGEEVEVLYYTDDEDISEANLILEANWSPIDELEGDFEIVTWTDAESIAQQQLEMNAVPKPQFIYLNESKHLYELLHNISVLDASNSYRNDTRLVLADGQNQNWYTWDKSDNSFKNIDISNSSLIEQNGMKIEELLSITNDEWIKWNKDSINIGIYLKDNPRDTIVSVIGLLSYTKNVPLYSSFVENAKMYILNTTPKLDIDYSNNKLIGVLSDDDSTRVQYRILLNGESYFPNDGSFTSLNYPSQNIELTINNSNVKIGQTNTLTVEFRDYFGTVNSWTTTFIGKYIGLIFSNSNGQHYSNAFGEILRYLDFGTMIAGQVTIEEKVVLSNTLPFKVKDIVLTSATSSTGIEVELSESANPFIPQHSLLYSQELDTDESISFYIRLKLKEDAVGMHEFDINVSATPA